MTRVFVTLSNKIRFYRWFKDSEGHWKDPVVSFGTLWEYLFPLPYNGICYFSEPANVFWETVGCRVFKGPWTSSVYTISNWDTQAALQRLFWSSNALVLVPVSWYLFSTSTFMVIDLSRFVLVSKYVPSGPRFAVPVGFWYLLFLRAPVTLCSSLKITPPGFPIKITHLDSCPLPLLVLLLTVLFLWLFPSLEREVVAGSEEGLLQSFSSPSGKLGRDQSISWMLWPAFSDFRSKKEGSWWGRRDSHSDAKQVRAGSVQSVSYCLEIGCDKICGSISAQNVSSQQVSRSLPVAYRSSYSHSSLLQVESMSHIPTRGRYSLASCNTVPVLVIAVINTVSTQKPWDSF